MSGSAAANTITRRDCQPPTSPIVWPDCEGAGQFCGCTGPAGGTWWEQVLMQKRSHVGHQQKRLQDPIYQNRRIQDAQQKGIVHHLKQINQSRATSRHQEPTVETTDQGLQKAISNFDSNFNKQLHQINQSRATSRHQQPIKSIETTDSFIVLKQIQQTKLIHQIQSNMSEPRCD